MTEQERPTDPAQGDADDLDLHTETLKDLESTDQDSGEVRGGAPEVDTKTCAAARPTC